VTIDAATDPPLRKTPKLTLPDEGAVTRFSVYEDVSDLYLDDVEELHALLQGACRIVIMELDEFANITLANIPAIKVEHIEGFTIRASDPLSVNVSIGPNKAAKVVVTISGKQKLVNALIHKLDMYFKSRQRFMTRVLRIPHSIQFAIFAMIFGGVFLVLAGQFIPRLPDALPMIIWGTLLAISLPTLGRAPAVVVRPIWKRDRPSHPPVNWGDKAVDFVQGLALVGIGYLLGEFF
jgi:hypothetical protein